VEWLLSEDKESVGEFVKKRGPLHTVDGNVHNHYEKQYGGSIILYSLKNALIADECSHHI
jgi:hypothetical protein